MANNVLRVTVVGGGLGVVLWADDVVAMVRGPQPKEMDTLTEISKIVQILLIEMMVVMRRIVVEDWWRTTAESPP
ncbi:hypothetical protein SLA2020_250420 [Shorea laevis]